MTTQHKVFFGGLPGTSKTTCGLSFPGVEQHVWGIGEEATRENFPDRDDILEPVKLLWRDCLSEDEKDELADDKTSDRRIDELESKARYLNVLRYKKYIFKLARDIEKGKRPELETVFLDNLSPFSDEFKAYVMEKYKEDFWTAEGNFDGRKFWPRYADELESFVRTVVSLPVNVVVSSHVALSLDQENSRRAFEKDASKLPREWLPNLDGKIRFGLGGLFSFCFFLWVEERPGLPNKYYAKAEADDKNIGLAKARIQPFPNPRKIELKKNNFYEQLVKAIEATKKKEVKK